METAIEVRNLRRTYRNFSLDGVSFTLPKGEVLGFIGPNGAGKTTTIRIMLGLARPDSGTVSLLGGSPSDRTIRERIGFVHDDTFLNEDLTAGETGSIVGPLYRSWDREEYRSRLARYGLDEKQKIAEFSKGMKIKLMLAIATSHNAELILMDEPTSGLDPVFRSEFLDELFGFMQEENRSVFFSTHITEDLNRIADCVVLLDRGRVVFEKTKTEIEESYRIVKGSIQLLSSGVLAPYFAPAGAPAGEHAGAHAGTPADELAGGAPHAGNTTCCIGIRRDEHSFTALFGPRYPEREREPNTAGYLDGAGAKRRAEKSDLPFADATGIVTERASLDDIMIYSTREDYRVHAGI